MGPPTADSRAAGDDRDGTFRTIYVGATLLACLLELLADFRPDPQVVDDLADIDEDDDDGELFSTVPAGRIDPTWLDPRVAGTAALSGDFCWVTTAQSLAALHPHFVAAALRAGLKDFDAAALKDGRPRELTQSVASYLYATTDLDGIRFASRHGDDLDLWAIFERDDTATPPCLTDTELTNSPLTTLRSCEPSTSSGWRGSDDGASRLTSATNPCRPADQPIDR